MRWDVCIVSQGIQQRNQAGYGPYSNGKIKIFNVITLKIKFNFTITKISFKTLAPATRFQPKSEQQDEGTPYLKIWSWKAFIKLLVDMSLNTYFKINSSCIITNKY